MRSALLALGLLAAPAARAQDMTSSMIESWAQTQNATMSAHIGALSVEGVAETQYGRPSAYKARQPDPSGPRAAAGRTGAASARVPFTASPALRRAVVEQQVAALRAKEPAAAQALSAQLARNDYGRIYAGLANGTGLSPDDAADVAAGLLALQWMIVNNVSVDPPPAAYRALRDQLAPTVLARPEMNDPAARARYAETLKLQTVLLHAGWQAARREGASPAFARSTARAFAPDGLLSRVALTSRGFVPRR